jgi:hypothetical protein
MLAGYESYAFWLRSICGWPSLLAGWLAELAMLFG